MTRQENILTLNEHLEHWKRLLSEKICDQSEGEKTIDALQNAIKALEQEPCEDCVSRQAIIDAIEDDNRNGHYSCFATNNDAQCFKDVIRELPSVTAQPKMGRWKWNFHCSLCNNIGERYYDYCPGCGAKMQEVEE